MWFIFCAVCHFTAEDENSVAPSGVESSRTFLALFGVNLQRLSFLLLYG